MGATKHKTNKSKLASPIPARSLGTRQLPQRASRAVPVNYADPSDDEEEDDEANLVEVSRKPLAPKNRQSGAGPLPNNTAAGNAAEELRSGPGYKYGQASGRNTLHRRYSDSNISKQSSDEADEGIVAEGSSSASEAQLIFERRKSGLPEAPKRKFHSRSNEQQETTEQEESQQELHTPEIIEKPPSKKRHSTGSVEPQQQHKRSLRSSSSSVSEVSNSQTQSMSQNTESTSASVLAKRAIAISGKVGKVAKSRTRRL